MKNKAPRMILVLTALVSLGWLSAFGQFGQNKVTYSNFDWQVYKSPHFDVHYYTEMEPFLEEIVSYAESAYLHISHETDHELRFRVPLVVYRTHGEFQQTNITLSDLPDGVGAFAEPVQNRMVLPIDLPADKLYQLIAHELTHIFEYSMFFEGYLGRALRSNPPLWLMEGLASYLGQDEDNLDRMAIRDAVVNNILPPIQSLGSLSFLTYRYGHAIFDYIEQAHGKEGLRSFLFEYRKVLLSNNLDKAIKESFGYDVDAFNRKFNRYLRQKYFPVLLEKKAPDDYGEEIGVKRPGVFTFSPTISPSGELVAVLSTPKLELDLMVLSAEDGEKVKNLTKGWSNQYRNLVANAFQGKRDLSWAPNGDLIAVFARRENKWPLVLFNGVTGKRVKEIPFKEIVQCGSPAFSPDGKRVAFEGNRDGVVDIFEVDLETREVRNLTQDDFFDTNPWYAADGKSLLYNRRIGSHWKIFSVDSDDASKKTQLTFGPSSDLQPSYSRDGETIYFSSDQNEYGVFNIYALDLQSGSMEQYTDVVGGCFAPVEMAEREGDRNLVFTAYFEGSFRLYRMPLLEPEQEIDVAQRMADPIEAKPFEPPLNLRVDEEQRQTYKAKWDLEAPQVAIGVTDNGTFLSNVALQFADLMGNQRVSITAASVDDFANYSAQYVNLRRRFNWGGLVYDFRDYFLQSTSSGVQREEAYRTTGASAFISYPFSRHYRFQASTGFQDRSQDIPVVQPDGLIRFESFDDRLATVDLSFTGDTTRFQSFGPFQGKRFSVGAFYGSQLSGDFDGDILEYRMDFRTYKQVTRRSTLAWRAATRYNAGDRENSYGFGGINQLRGYEFRDFAGSRLAWSNLEFRFPLVDELRFPILRLVQIRGFFFLDVGAAWYDDDFFYDPEFISPSGFKGDFRVDPSNGERIGFKFWDSDNDRLQDGRASYGTGFQFFFIGGLQFNWVWSRQMDYTQYVCDLAGCIKTEADTGGTRMDFYIAFDF